MRPWQHPGSWAQLSFSLSHVHLQPCSCYPTQCDFWPFAPSFPTHRHLGTCHYNMNLITASSYHSFTRHYLVMPLLFSPHYSVLFFRTLNSLIPLLACPSVSYTHCNFSLTYFLPSSKQLNMARKNKNYVMGEWIDFTSMSIQHQMK